MRLARSRAAVRGAVRGRRTMFIQTVDTPNPDSMMFYPQVKLLEEEGSIDFPSLKAAAKSPLARALFTIEGVTGVLFSPEYITLKKDPAVPWTEGAASFFRPVLIFPVSFFLLLTLLPSSSQAGGF